MGDLYATFSTAMPLDAPSALDPDVHAKVVSYLLDTEQLRAIPMASPGK